MNYDRITMKWGFTETQMEMKMKMEKVICDENQNHRIISATLLDEWFIMVQKVKHIQNFHKYFHLRMQTYFTLLKSNIQHFVYSIIIL